MICLQTNIWKHINVHVEIKRKFDNSIHFEGLLIQTDIHGSLKEKNVMTGFLVFFLNVKTLSQRTPPALYYDMLFMQ